MAFLRPRERTARLNRFQTPAPGITFVRTAVDGHFDPYAETTRGVSLSAAAMERVAKIEVDAGAAPAARKAR